MPTDLPRRSASPPIELDAQAALLSDALMTNDAFLVSQALNDIAQAQGQHRALGDDPKLSAVLAALEALNIELVARRAAS